MVRTQKTSKRESLRVWTFSKQTQFSLITPLGIIYITSFTKGKNENDLGLAKRRNRKRLLCSSLEECRSRLYIVNKSKGKNMIWQYSVRSYFVKNKHCTQNLEYRTSTRDRYTVDLLMNLIPRITGLNSMKVTAFHLQYLFHQKLYRPLDYGNTKLRTCVCNICRLHVRIFLFYFAQQLTWHYILFD